MKNSLFHTSDVTTFIYPSLLRKYQANYDLEDTHESELGDC